MHLRPKEYTYLNKYFIVLVVKLLIREYHLHYKGLGWVLVSIWYTHGHSSRVGLVLKLGWLVVEPRTELEYRFFNLWNLNQPITKP